MSREFVIFFLAMAALSVVLGSEAGHSVKFAAVLIVLVWSLVWNVMRLHRSVVFYREVKDLNGKKPKLTSALITRAWRRRRWYISTDGARAAYRLDGKKVKGRMICACDDRLDKDDRVDVIVCRRYEKLFAMSVKHVRDAVLTYSVFSILSLLMTAGWIVVIVMYIIDTH